MYWLCVIRPLPASLLFAARKSILGEAESTMLSRALTFVHDEYKPALCWWEARALR